MLHNQKKIFMNTIRNLTTHKILVLLILLQLLRLNLGRILHYTFSISEDVLHLVLYIFDNRINVTLKKTT